MREFRIRTDLERAVIDGFALPLGVEPTALKPPSIGYTVEYVPGEEDEPDTYGFHIVVSHEQVGRLLHRAFELLPRKVFGIVEIGSRDAYRSVDVFMSREPIPREEFLQTWRQFEPILLDEVAIAAGANSEDPFVEVFLDQWKGITINVPLTMRDQADSMLNDFGLQEVEQTWQDYDEADEPASIRAVLDLSDDESPDLDDLLFELRYGWRLELGVDPETNIDEGGRPLGLTLWHAVVMLDPVNSAAENGSYASIWATAASLSQMDKFMGDAFADHPTWRLAEVFTVDRVAFDERPEALSDLAPRRHRPEIHLVQIDAETGESPERRSIET